jgi:hypothetical protein
VKRRRPRLDCSWQVRRSVFQELGGSAPAVAVTSAGTATRFSFPEEFLFPKTGLDLTAPGDAALSLVKDFIQTHRTVYVGVVCEQDTKADEDSQRRNIRRTIALGAPSLSSNRVGADANPD